MDFLIEIYDYLPIKQEQTEIVINYCIRALERIKSTRHLHSGSIKWKATWKLTQEDLDDYAKMRELNKKGPSS